MSDVNPGDLLTLDIEKPVAGGRMLARHDGRVVLVWGAIPGERVRARVDRVTRHLAFAAVVQPLTSSPDRRAVSADWRCGGNSYAHIAYERQRALKSLIVRDAFARIAHLTLDADPAVEGSPEGGYRMRARLHARDGAVGFFREGTHEVCDLAESRQLLDESVMAVHSLQQALARDPHARPGTIDLSENIPATQRVIHLDFPSGASLPDAVLFAERTFVTGLTASAGGAELRTLFGDPYVTDDLDLGFARIRLRRHVRAFFQGNRYLLSALVARVTSQVAVGDEVLDLYAGGGLFSVALAARGGSRVIAVEGDAAAGEDLKWNGRLYGTTLLTHRRSVEAYLHDHVTFGGTIVVDPPRMGLSPEAAQRIGQSGAKRIVYVSCDVATLARDVKGLREAGYQLANVEAFDMFPNTAHIESMAVLSR